MKCPNCNETEHEPTAKYCHVCGAKLTVTLNTSKDGGEKPKPDIHPDRTIMPEDIMAVDLGLPSGTLWATCNVGASKPEDYGNYYAWGETFTKDTYVWDTYKYYANGDSNKLTKYCNNSLYGNNGFTDNLTVLQVDDDPAASNWGSGWRMPSEAQWEELLSNTTNMWTELNGVKGWQFTSKKNSFTIFLPAAGVCWRGLTEVGIRGYYWSNSLDTGYQACARYFSFYSFSSDYRSMNYYNREYGLSVRPVRVK